MTWLLGLLAAFAYLGNRRRQPRINSVNVHLTALILILLGLGYAAVKYHLL
jgi:hypothetical protein